MDVSRNADALVACVAVISMDVLSRTLLEDGTIRSERLIGVQQDSPKWVNRVRLVRHGFHDAPGS